MTPCFGGKSSPFMGSHDPEGHWQGQTVIHSRNLFVDKGVGKLGINWALVMRHSDAPFR
jgi:hypothetical protein